MLGILPYFYNALIVKGLTEKGILVVNHAIMPGSVITKNGEDYKIKSLIKIDGFSNAHLKIKRCDSTPLTSQDLENLKEKEIIKITVSPVGKIRPGYDI